MDASAISGTRNRYRGVRLLRRAAAGMALAAACAEPAACHRDADDVARALAWSRAGELGGLEIRTRVPLAAPAGARHTLTFAVTSDLKGRLVNDTADGGEGRSGLLQLVEPIRELRAQDPELILLDAGDALAGFPGSPWGGPAADPDAPHPMLHLMNLLGYDAMALGNQDLAAGQKLLQAWQAQSRFPWLAANLLRQGGGTLLRPYALLERQGVRVAVLGMTTPGAGAWLDPERLQDLGFEDLLPATQRWARVLRELEQADVVVGLFHSGVDGGYDREAALRKGLPLPDGAGEVADRVGGLDLVVAGHAHRLAPVRPRDGRSAYHVPVVQPGAYGAAMSVVRMEVEARQGRWHVSGVLRSALRARPVEAIGRVADARTAAAIAALRAYRAQPTAVRLRRVPSRSVFDACAGLLTHRVVLAATEAQGAQRPSPTAPAGAGTPALSRDATEPAYSLLPHLWRYDADAFPEPGEPIRRGHVMHWMPYDNTLVLVRLDPRQMALLLEPYIRYTRHNKVRLSEVLYPGGMTPEVAASGTDVLRVFDDASGQELRATRTYPVWLSNHHRNGGGGLAPMALIHPSQDVRRDSRLLRQLVFDALSDPAARLPPPCPRFLEHADG